MIRVDGCVVCLQCLLQTAPTVIVMMVLLRPAMSNALAAIACYTARDPLLATASCR
jgi:hypothetical protein